MWIFHLRNRRFEKPVIECCLVEMMGRFLQEAGPPQGGLKDLWLTQVLGIC